MAMGGPSDDDRGEPDESEVIAFPTRAPLVQRMVGEVGLEIATTPEGRAAGLSVEIWPDDGVWLRVRSGHELRVLVDETDGGVTLRWERREPRQDGPSATGELGPAAKMTADDLRTFAMRWLSERLEA